MERGGREQSEFYLQGGRTSGKRSSGFSFTTKDNPVNRIVDSYVGDPIYYRSARAQDHEGKAATDSRTFQTVCRTNHKNADEDSEIELWIKNSPISNYQ